jgi:SAM-dependent methyltransferase
MTDKLLDLPSCAPRPDDTPNRGAGNGSSSSEQIAYALRAGLCPEDVAFDHFLSEPMRSQSSQHWTPLVVAARAAQWFDECRVRTVVDIGSGAGKFCVAAALAGHCHFTGLEHRAHLVSSARMLARTFKVENRVHFIQGALGNTSVPVADAYYFYNPFEENVSGPAWRIDGDVELSLERHGRDLMTVRELLVAARTGTYVLTYNGLGAKLPASYKRVRTDRELPNVLCLWRKTAARTISRLHSADRGWSAGVA